MFRRPARRQVDPPVAARAPALPRFSAAEPPFGGEGGSPGGRRPADPSKLKLLGETERVDPPFRSGWSRSH
eukprot:541363-Pyramimonas_sp.AAC.1